VSDCKSINQTFAEGKDTYKVFASQLYNINYDQVTKTQRTFCKPPVLGGGFGLGWKGLIGYAEGMGVTMSEKEAKIAIDVFRTEYHEIVELWDWLKTAVFYTTRTGNECTGKHGLRTFARGEFLLLRLPSGRNIAYHLPRIELKEAPWGDMIDNFTFMGMDQYTKKWGRISAHGGKIVENVVQSVARDILATWLDRADAAGFNIVGHCHDEIISLEKTDRVEELNDLIRQPVTWAEGLLLDAQGYVARRYRKD
jgi:DNA polymerase